MPRFVDPNARVPVTLGGDTIYIRAKMSVLVRGLVNDELVAKGLGSREEMSARGIGSYRMALLVHNIVAWEGPGFVGESGKPIACTRANIERLDPNDPLIERVWDEITERNAPPEAPEDADPN